MDVVTMLLWTARSECEVSRRTEASVSELQSRCDRRQHDGRGWKNQRWKLAKEGDVGDQRQLGAGKRSGSDEAEERSEFDSRAETSERLREASPARLRSNQTTKWPTAAAVAAVETNTSAPTCARSPIAFRLCYCLLSIP